MTKKTKPPFPQPDVVDTATLAEMIDRDKSLVLRMLADRPELGAVRLSSGYVVSRAAAEWLAAEYEKNPPQRGVKKQNNCLAAIAAKKIGRACRAHLPKSKNP